jgi:gluconolactonase
MSNHTLSTRSSRDRRSVAARFFIQSSPFVACATALACVLAIGACGSKSSGKTDNTANGGGGGGAGGDGGAGPSPIEGTAAPMLVIGDVGGSTGYLDGPRWNGDQLVVSDPLINNGTGVTYMVKLSDIANVSSVYRQPSNATAGTALDKNKNLISAETKVPMMNHGRVTRVSPDGTSTTIADSYMQNGMMKPMDAPNDVTVRQSDGTIYVTDPGYQNAATTNHVFVIDTSGKVTVADECDNVCHPNGIALSPKEDFLYVGYTYYDGSNTTPLIKRFPINANGTLGTGTPWAAAPKDVDGFAIDDNGNLYAASADGVVVYSSNGDKIGTIPLSTEPDAVAFGGPDRKMLFITSQAAIYSVTVNVPGRTQ